MKRIRMSLLIIGSLLILTGCMPSYSVEDYAIIQLIGFDMAEEGKIRGTVSIPQYGRSEQKTTAKELYVTSIADTVKELEAKFQSKSASPLSIGKLDVQLYNEDLAKKGLNDYLDVLSRNPRIGRNMFLAVVKGETKSMVEGDYTQAETTANYLTGLIENNIYSNFPKTNLHNFLFAYYGEGMDGYLPYLKKNESYVKIQGIALFDGAKMASTIPASDAFIFKMLREPFRGGIREIPFQEGRAVLESIGSHVNYKIRGNKEQPGFVIDIRMKGVINEAVGIEAPDKPSTVREMEREFSKYFSKKGQEMMDKLQEEKVDPLGLGNQLKNRRRNFDIKNWEDQYPTVPIKVNVKVKITGTGIFS